MARRPSMRSIPAYRRHGHGGVANPRAETWTKLGFSWLLGNERLVKIERERAGLEESRVKIDSRVCKYYEAVK